MLWLGWYPVLRGKNPIVLCFLNLSQWPVHSLHMGQKVEAIWLWWLVYLNYYIKRGSNITSSWFSCASSFKCTKTYFTYCPYFVVSFVTTYHMRDGTVSLCLLPCMLPNTLTCPNSRSLHSFAYLSFGSIFRPTYTPLTNCSSAQPYTTINSILKLEHNYDLNCHLHH